MANDKPCTSCRHCKKTFVPDTPACHMECTYFTSDPDPIDGHVTLGKCRELRKPCQPCSAWEQGGLKGFIQRLFKL